MISNSGPLIPVDQHVNKGISKLTALLTVIIVNFYGCCHVMEAWRSMEATEVDHCGFCRPFYVQR